MIKKIFFVLAACLSLTTFGQEVLLPPFTHQVLTQSASKKTSQSQFNKTSQQWPANFPLVDGFDKTLIDTLNWQFSNAQPQNGVMVFNAQNTAGNTYNNADGSYAALDVLLSKPLNMLQVPAICYFNFDVETGHTFQTNDSLVLEALNAAGNWQTIWKSPTINFAWRNFNFEFPVTLEFQHASLQFRFTNYGASLAANVNSFRVNHFVFSVKKTLPWVDNVLWNEKQARVNFTVSQGDLRDGKSNQINWGNVIKLDGLNGDGFPYNNGFADTVQTQSVDLSTLKINDSVFFRFYFKAINITNADSIIIFFKNNSAQWIRQASFAANQANDWRTFVANVNIGRFRHKAFEVRIITRGTSTNIQDTAKWLVSGFDIGKRLLIPFVDDFSLTNVYPDSAKWVNQHVFVNNQFPKLPPSINVATFDGLNRIGVPYGSGRGYCDTLTSYPIRLDGLTGADSVYLSFFVQPKGLGVSPDTYDSLILEARTTAASKDSFTIIWSALPSQFSKDTFSLVRIWLNPTYLHDNFEMRFKNVGSRTGNLNHWHIDYVFIDKGRTNIDAFFDLSIQSQPNPLLKKYSSLPYTHFLLNPASHLTDTQFFNVKNNYEIASGAVSYGREVFEQNFQRIDTFGSALPQVPAYKSVTAALKKSISVSTPQSTDSVYLWSRFFIKLGNTIDNIRSNDTLWQPTFFSNYYAYDDGTAEAGYAIENSVGQVALRYELAKADSIFGLSVHFNRGKTDVSDLPFNLVVWKKLGPPEEALIKVPAKAVYYNARNGFHYVKFDEPIWAENEIYVGWEQNQVFPLNVGFDLNYQVDYQYKPNPEMYYNIQGVWQKTGLWGALMMRPIVGKWVEPQPVGLNKTTLHQLQVDVYPNPANQFFKLSGDRAEKYGVSLYDLNGKLCFEQIAYANEAIYLNNQSAGMYFVKIKSLKTNLTTTKKILLQSN